MLTALSKAARLEKKLKSLETGLQLNVKKLARALESKQNISSPLPANQSAPLSPHSSSESTTPSTPQTPETTMFPGTPKHIPPNTTVVIKDIQKNMKTSKNNRKWTNITLSICTFILLTSATAYFYLSRNILLPSRATLYRFINSFHPIDIEKITNIGKVSQTLSDYRAEFSIPDEVNIPGTLAVDAISLTPHVMVKQNGSVYGLTKNVLLQSDELERLKVLINEQEKLISRLQSDVITSAFVYYFQPFDPTYRCMAILILGSNSGKASSAQVDTFFMLSNVLASSNFTVMCYASDGDSAYSTLVNDTVSRWNSHLRPILKFTKPLYSNDPLHVCKRGRYRLLTHDLVLMEKNGERLNVTAIQDILNLPSIVFYDARITKMQDSLPLQLFSLQSFLTVEYSEMFSECAFMLPFTLLITALTAKDITLDERADLLEILIHYMNFYKEESENTSKEIRGVYKGKENSVLFDTNLINDIISTAISINSVINGFQGTVSLNRIGTNPLEHHFGLLRIRCKFNHNFEKVTKEETKLKVLHEIEKETVGNAIHSRKATFGDIITLNGEIHGEKSKFTNREIAYAVLLYFNVPLQHVKINRKINECFVVNAYSEFVGILRRVGSRDGSRKRIDAVDSHDLACPGSAGAFIAQRQENSKIIKTDYATSASNDAATTNVKAHDDKTISRKNRSVKKKRVSLSKSPSSNSQPIG